MTKTIDEVVTMLDPLVQSGGRFVWRGREHRINCIGGRWSQGGRWWLGENHRLYIHITTLDNLAMNLCYDELDQSWHIAELKD
jgi:hypothetical protein